MKKKIKFEKFVETKSWFGGEPEVSLLEKGGFGFSTAFNKKFKLSDAKYATLHFAQDEDYYYIGFVFSNDSNMPGSLKIYHPKKDYGLIQCISFFKKYDIDPSKYKKRYVIEEQSSEDTGKIYVINVRK